LPGEQGDIYLLFPAYAGVIRGEAGKGKKGTPVPRIRGGDPFIPSSKNATLCCSPHTRG